MRNISEFEARLDHCGTFKIGNEKSCIGFYGAKQCYSFILDEKNAKALRDALLEFYPVEQPK